MPEEPDRHVTPHFTVYIDRELWREFGQVVGDRKRSDVVRDMIAAFLKRPGAKIPRRKDYESPQA